MFVLGATILHADLDAFYASVEQRDDPRLRGRPVIVGAGVVLAASYKAKACGVRTAMGGRQARRLCPSAIVVPPRMSAYAEASKAAFRVFEDSSPLVEGLSIDEAFLDVRGLERISGTPVEIAARLRRDVRERVGLPITVGVARTKFLAKVASGVAKPDGLLVVPPDGELSFLHPLPVERLWGVGPATARKLHERKISTVGEVARLSESVLVTILGRAAGRHLYALAHNRDPRPVIVGRRRRSIGSQCALGRSRKTPEAVDAVLVSLVDRVTRRMRIAGRVGRTVVLRLRFGDFSRATRSHTLPQPIAHTQTILLTARWLLAGAMPEIERRGLASRPLQRHRSRRRNRRSAPAIRIDGRDACRSTRARTGIHGAAPPGLIRRGSISSMKTLEIDTPFGTANAHLDSAGDPRAALVLGHGAGGGVQAKDLVAVAHVAHLVGLSVALIEQPYRVAGRRSPAPAHQLDAAWTAVIDHLVAGELRDLSLVVGGRSSGARVACRTAEATGAVGVLCLAFPLQPPRRSGAKPAQNRLFELDAVTVATLVVQGTRDQFGIPPATESRTVVQVAGDHSLGTDLATVSEAVRTWFLQVVLGSHATRTS
jgi:DNA polymerase IV